ncbi:MAG: hypothetical protein JOS17DRAFT_762196 [Linnemannia elongata]|nr:MAG: hypothetical protein JOS17DRAFT_762196 [Linnemannia elongata]
MNSDKANDVSGLLRVRGVFITNQGEGERTNRGGVNGAGLQGARCLCPVTLGRCDLGALSRFIYIVEPTLVRFPVSEFHDLTDMGADHIERRKNKKDQYQRGARLAALGQVAYIGISGLLRSFFFIHFSFEGPETKKNGKMSSLWRPKDDEG